MWAILTVLAWAASLACCLRLYRVASRVGEWGADGSRRSAGGLSLYEAAFLAGGPRRVSELTLARMARERRLLLAHTGWVTVVRPEADDALERAVLAAIGPQEQAPIPHVCAGTARSEPAITLGEGLVADGLAVAAPVHAEVASVVRQVRLTALGVAGLWLASLGLTPLTPPATSMGVLFALPLLLIGGCALIARGEISARTRRATAVGRRALTRLRVPRQRGPLDRLDPLDDGALLAALAVHGPRVLPESESALRAALTKRTAA
ncbi:TIGR04222 domain-containing membrane protein [Streptomyces polyrhachis]|uniref:TIGR04222 domain-containing membrane protein n=1 Tax=Streptomyces polyrhachis TaxID=1282885 RepID=A0ABW2GFZ7_9ACTN